MSEFLLELFSEEIPARMQKGASELLKTRLAEAFAEHKLDYVSLDTFATPRRLVAVVKGLPTQIASLSQERRGPRIGAPEGAIEGFCRSAGITRAELEERDGFYFAVTSTQGGAVAPVLKTVVEKILSTFHWPKTMRWGAYPLHWVRPLQSILCLFAGQVVPVQFGHITASNTTRGHRFLSNGEAIAVQNADDYFAQLKQAFVIVRQDDRRAHILEHAHATAKAQGLALKEDIGLLEEVTGLVEWPVVLMGGFDPKFTRLPKEVPTTVMRSHQKYFALHTAAGELAPHFITVSNMQAADGGKTIIAGNERVLRARLEDGQFFYDQDLNHPLSHWAEGLNDMVFHAKLGSVAEKVERIRELAVHIAQFIPHADKADVKRAAELCKSDLTTGMVGEFPELQGLMGRYYALAQGEKPEVANAIRDHYSPLGPSDTCPSEPVAIAVALADKIDTLVGLFAVGEKPTGSKDPFALRRAALGVIRLILENNLRIHLNDLIEEAMRAYPSSFYREVAKEETKETGRRVRARKLRSHTEEELMEFFSGRIKVMLREQGIGHDRIEAIFNEGEETDMFRLVKRVRALQHFLTTDDGANLVAAYRRAANIVRIEEEATGSEIREIPDLKLLEQAEEKALFDAVDTIFPKVEKAWKFEDFEAAMAELSRLRAPIDAFFDNVTVNCDDKKLRQNRLRLLSMIRNSLDNLGNFALIEA